MKLLHLYHDVMNLYGEYANLKILIRLLEKSNIVYQFDQFSLADQVSVLDYDLIYIGSGTERKQKQILPHLMGMRDDLRQYIDRGKLLLMTGNAFEVLGKRITDASGKDWEGLGFFPFIVKEQKRTRTTADAIAVLEGLEQPLVGFVNKCSTIEGIDTPLFQLEMGLGNDSQAKEEGIREKNCLGTHLTGPILVKNPYFLLYLAQILCGDQPLNQSWMGEEKAAYEVTLRELRGNGAAKG